MESATEIRRAMRARRRRLTPEERRAAAAAVARRLAALRPFRAAARIAAYHAVRGELDAGPALSRAGAMGKRLYAPVLPPFAVNRLWFAPFDRERPWRPNRFGIPEPRYRHRELAAPAALDLVLVPLVAFDPECRRLGMGGGYYDRTFAFRRHRDHWRKPRLIGIAYEFQKVAELPVQPWDVPLDLVVTEAGVYRPGRKAGESTDVTDVHR